MNNWLKADDGDWVNLALAVRVRLGPRAAPQWAFGTPPPEEAEPDHATIWFLDGAQSTVSGDLTGLRAVLEGKPPKDALVGAYRKG